VQLVLLERKLSGATGSAGARIQGTTGLSGAVSAGHKDTRVAGATGTTGAAGLSGASWGPQGLVVQLVLLVHKEKA
jgi:hypothetical protein